MDNFSTLLNLKNAGPQKEEIQDFSKILSLIKKELYIKPFFNNCQICRKVNIKFCNSHTIPRFILKNIADKGRLYNVQAIKENPVVQQENGIENAQTFKSICSECDSKIFQEYETPENWLKIPNDNMLSQIALKCHLYYQYKLTRDLRMIEYVNRKFFEGNGVKAKKSPFYNIYEMWNMDKKYHAREVQRIYSNINKKENLFKIGYFQKLPYVIPIVFQGTFAIYFDLQNKKLNNPFSTKIDGLSNVYLCLYPFQDGSIVLIFYENKNTKYDKFFQELSVLDLEEQLSIINFLIFAYSEDIFISKNVDSSIFRDINLQNTAFIQPITFTKRSNTKEMQKARIEAFKREYKIDNHKACPNLLSKKFAI